MLIHFNRDEDLQKAIRLSEQEAQEKERKQREKLERENQEKLFGSNNQSSRYNESLKDKKSMMINMTLYSFNPFPANQSFDSSLNPYQQQQQWPQNTGMTNMTFSDPISANNQQLGFQNTGMTSNPYQQQQSNPYQQFPGFGQNLQAQMTGMPQQITGMAPFQTSTMTGFQQPQITGFQQPQMTGFQQSQMTGFPQQQQQQPSMSTVSSSPMASFQQPQITAASNNPFGPLNNQQQPQSTGMFGQSLTASPSLASSSLAPRSPSMSVATANTSAAGQSRSFTFPSPSMQVSLSEKNQAIGGPCTQYLI